MTTILIVVLFVLQLLSFYFIIILNTKLAQFKDLEKKQERLMREMDDTISLYLAEMKDENDRLINELQKVPKQKTHVIAEPIEQDEKSSKQQNERETQQVKVENSTKEVNKSAFEVEPRVLVPKKTVANAYSRQQHASTNVVNQSSSVATLDDLLIEKKKEQTFEEQVAQLSKEGKNIEEIAKKLQKGKTEIELLLKFHS